MPLVWINGIVINLLRCAKGPSAICAANKHYVRRASSGLHHTRQHVNVVVSRSSGMVDRQEQHAIKSCRIYSASEQNATHIDRRHLVKGWRLAADLRVARAHTIERAGSFAANKKVTIR